MTDKVYLVFRGGASLIRLIRLRSNIKRRISSYNSAEDDYEDNMISVTTSIIKARGSPAKLVIK